MNNSFNFGIDVDEQRPAQGDVGAPADGFDGRDHGAGPRVHLDQLKPLGVFCVVSESHVTELVFLPGDCLHQYVVVGGGSVIGAGSALLSHDGFGAIVEGA